MSTPGNYFDSVADYRYNPFTDSFAANPIGKSGNPPEHQTIPSSGPYFVFLDELPRQDSPSSLAITDHITGTPFTEVSVTTPPAAGQYRLIYAGTGLSGDTTGKIGQGMVEFYSSDAGTEIDIEYYGLGTIIQRQSWGKGFNEPITALNNLKGNMVVEGGLVTESSPAGMTVQVAGGSAIINGKLVTWNATETATISTPSNRRSDLIIVDEDGVVSQVDGVDATDDYSYGTVTSSQVALASYQITSATISIVNSAIQMIGRQGAMALNYETRLWSWFFLPSAAIGSLDDGEGGEIHIRDGLYFDEMVLTENSNVSILMNDDSLILRKSSTSYCINGSGSGSFSNIKITGGKLFGNGRAGSVELMKIEGGDNFEILNVSIGSNTSSTATYPSFLIDDCTNFRLDNYFVSGDYSTSAITNSSLYLEDGHHKDEIVFCGSATEKANMLKKGWYELAAADGKFIRINNTAAGGTGGDDEHNHKWHTANGDTSNNTTYNSSGSAVAFSAGSYIGSAGSTNAIGWVYKHTESAWINGQYYTSEEDNRPAFYEVIGLIHR